MRFNAGLSGVRLKTIQLFTKCMGFLKLNKKKGVR